MLPDGFSRICIPHWLGEGLLRKVKRAAVVNVNELFERCRALLAENNALREENEALKARLRVTDLPPDPPQDLKDHRPLAYSAPGVPEKLP